MKHNRLDLGGEVRPSCQPDEGFEVALEFDLRHTRGWLTKLSTATPGNRLNVFYFRDHQEPVSSVDGTTGTKTYRIDDGTYEAEFTGAIAVHRIAFQVRDHGLVWIGSMTLGKHQVLRQIAAALSPSGAR